MEEIREPFPMFFVFLCLIFISVSKALELEDGVFHSNDYVQLCFDHTYIVDDIRRSKKKKKLVFYRVKFL